MIMLIRRVALLQQCSCLKNIYSLKSTNVKVESSELSFPTRYNLPIPKPKLPKKEPFIKSLFVGKFDNDMLTYPEAQTDERHREFFEWLKPIEAYMRTVDAKKLYESSSFPTDMREKLKEFGVCRGRIPKDYEGLDFLNTEYLKLIETLSIVPKVGLNFIECNNYPVELLKKYGSVKQKYEYLRGIATGQYIPIICANETEHRVDPEKLQTLAVLSDDETFWTINGMKTFVQEDDNANLFIVYSYADITGNRRQLNKTISTFIIDKNTPGVGECIPIESPWLGKSNMFSVKFEDVIIPKENLIGEVGEGIKTLEEYFTTELTFSAGVYIAILKKYLNSLIKHVINSTQFERECVKNIIMETSCSLYAMESVAYLTTGLVDLYEGQDVVAEEAAVKEFCGRECIKRLQDSFQLLDTHLCTENYPLEEIIRNQIFGLQGDADLKTYIGLLGMQFAGKTLNSHVKKSRNPFEYPHFMLRKFFGLEEHFINLHLEENLHPSFQDQVIHLQESFNKMQKYTETLLIRHGVEVITHEIDIQRISEMAILIYAVTAAFGRASRSYCIGLRNSEYEVKLAMAFAYRAYMRIDYLAKEIDDGDILNGNIYKVEASQRIYEMKKYCMEHPLERNW